MDRSLLQSLDKAIDALDSSGPDKERARMEAEVFVELIRPYVLIGSETYRKEFWDALCRAYPEEIIRHPGDV